MRSFPFSFQSLIQVVTCCRNGQALSPWLKYNYIKMRKIGGALRERAPDKCRVILAGVGDAPSCFNAHVIVDNAPNLKIRNVVAVTADLALQTIGTLASVTRTSRATIGQPPVWGFVGLNKMVDFNYAYHVTDVFRLKGGPTKEYSRSSTLQPGTQTVELRNMTYLLDHEPSLHRKVTEKKLQIEGLLQRSLYLPKVRATVDLLTHWLCDKERSNICLSLGVSSNGTFGLPRGLYFSQPVTLVDGFWKPFSDFPLPLDPHCRLVDLAVMPMHILKQFGLGNRCKGMWLMSEARRKDMREQKEKQHVENLRRMRTQLEESWKIMMRNVMMEQGTMARNTADKVEELREVLREEEQRLKRENIIKIKIARKLGEKALSVLEKEE
ncbi:putative malate dehydrogenase 1B [Periplaneta americana]|uniref:putative malate dehydrogenase 1B n=1 Tax=Periplaneta americana TaxID=6978 RepID=UPI0037E9AD94